MSVADKAISLHFLFESFQILKNVFSKLNIQT